MKTYDGVFKRMVRELAVDWQGVAKTAVFLPSDSCLCLKLAIDKKKINKNTFIIAVEKDYKKVKIIENFLKSNFKNYYMHHGEIHQLNIDKFIIDRAYFDFCGQISDNIIDFLNKINIDDAELSFTFHIAIRNNKLINILNSLNYDYLNGFKNQIYKTGIHLLYKNGYKKSVESTLLGIYLSFIETVNIKLQFAYEYNDTSPMLFSKWKLTN